MVKQSVKVLILHHRQSQRKLLDIKTLRLNFLNFISFNINKLSIYIYSTYNLNFVSLTVVNQSKEGLLHEQLSVEDHQFSGRRDQIVAFVELKEFHKYLRLIFLCKKINRCVTYSEKMQNVDVVRSNYYQTLHSSFTTIKILMAIFIPFLIDILKC